jgi:hypothetical protein
MLIDSVAKSRTAINIIRFILLLAKNRKYIDPDRLASPSGEIRRLVPEFRKIDGARRMGQHLPVDERQNRSHSFKVFLTGLRGLLAN